MDKRLFAPFAWRMEPNNWVVEHVLRDFMDRRFNAWRFPAESRPLWFAVSTLYADFEQFYWEQTQRAPSASQMRLCSLILEWAAQSDLGLRAAELKDKKGMAIVHYPPSATEWLQYVMLPRIPLSERRELRTPTELYAMVDTLLKEQSDQSDCVLLFTRDELAQAVREYFDEDQTQSEHYYILPEIVEASVDRSMLAVDPYADARCLYALRYGLSCLNVDA